MRLKKEQILKKFKPFLWSYDIDKIDLNRDKKRIITNVLNFGTIKATDLLFEVFDRVDIEKIVKKPIPGEWSDKSLNYWSIIFDIKPIRAKNVLRHIR